MKGWTMKAAVVALVVLAGAAVLHSGPAAGQESKPGLVLNVTSGREDLHAVTMALQLAGHGLNDGRAVTLFLNVRAPDLARADLPESLAFGGNPPVRKMLADLLGRGATVLVCPACAEAMGVKASDLLAGVEMATREALFAKLDANTVVFTY